METKEVKRQTELKAVNEWECHQRKRKGVNYAKGECQAVEVKAKLKQCSKYVIFALLFDYAHYDLWVFFPEHLQLYVYDASQSLSFLFYIYAIYKVFDEFKDLLPIIYAVVSTWLWFSIGDAVTMVYSNKTLEGLHIEYYCVLFNVMILCYKYRGNIRFYLEILRFNFKIDRYEGVLG